jgi:hypothetical protein
MQKRLALAAIEVVHRSPQALLGMPTRNSRSLAS